MKVSVLIVGGGLQAISTARSLKEKGYRVISYSSHKDYSIRSSAIDTYRISNDGLDICEIIGLIKDQSIRAAIPMSDNAAMLLSKHKELIFHETGCVAAVPDYAVIDVAADKLKLMNLCAEHELPHPLTFKDSALDKETLNKLKYPLLIKPNHSVGARGILKVSSESQLKENLPILQSKYGDCHIQEYIAGDRPYYNVMIYRNKNKEIVNSTILEILRYYPLAGGSSSLCKTISNRSLIELCSNVLDILNYVGFADFDVLQTEEGDYKIIEINPRVPASLRGAAISGVNFPAIIVGDALGENETGGNYTPGKFLRYLGLDIMWFISSSHRFKAKPSWFDFFGKNIFYQEGGWKDLKPMLAALWGNLNKIEFKGGMIRKKREL